MNLTPAQVKAQGLPANPRDALLKRITRTPKTRAIIENGEQLDVTPEEFLKVRRVKGLIYYCPECRAYHLFDGKDFEDVEAILGIEVSNKMRYGSPKEHEWLGVPA